MNISLLPFCGIVCGEYVNSLLEICAISLSLDWNELDSFVQVTYSSVYRGTVYFLGCMVLRPWNRKGQCCFNPLVFLNLENYLFILLFSANWK